MKYTSHVLLLLIILFSCSSKTKTVTETSAKAVYIQKDKEIFEQILQQVFSRKRCLHCGIDDKSRACFIDTPYVAHTLEDEPEQLVINLRELDCTTFAESVLAISRTVKSENPSFEQFATELQNLRYRNGIMDGYPSRIHYFSDWIFENNKRNLIKDVSEEIANIPYPLKVNFMSTHPASYVQLKDSTLIPAIAKQEQEISSRQMFYIPEDKLAEFENLLQDGDIAGITTSM
jgi:hypothetical protein